jgi:cation diffusion facilitator family transporter
MMSEHAHRGLRSTLVGILVNFALAMVKGTAGFLGNSYALIADAVESTIDIFSSAIVWSGLKISTRPPDASHPYGYGKAEPIAGMVVSLALIAAGIGIAVQSVAEIVTPHHSPAPFTLAVLIVVVVVKETLFRFVFSVGESTQSTAVKGDAWHHRSDALTSAAAFVGILVSLIGGQGFESADDWAALIAVPVILFNAYRIFIPAINEVMDSAPPDNIHETICEAARRVEGVVALEKCLVRKMGFSYYVDLHVTVDGSLSVRKGHDIGRTVRQAIRKQNTHVADVLVHVEPSDLADERPGTV